MVFLFCELLVTLLFTSVFSHRSVKSIASLHASPNAKCVLFCHLPPPFHPWHDFLEVCDPAKSLFIDTDSSVLKKLQTSRLSAQDIVEVADLATFSHEGCSQEQIRISIGYQILKADLDVAQAVLFGEVVDVEESKAQRKLVTTKWAANGNDEAMRCLAVVALDEIAQIYKKTRFPNPDKYKERRSKCFRSGGEPVSLKHVEQARVQAEEALPRTNMIASHGGRAALVAKLAAALPPSSETCGSLEECLASRFMNTTTWTPPENLANTYDKAIFVGCNHFAFKGKAVETAVKLMKPGGELIVSGPTPEQLFDVYGITSFDKLSDGWARSSREGLTVFSGYS